MLYNMSNRKVDYVFIIVYSMIYHIRYSREACRCGCTCSSAVNGASAWLLRASNANCGNGESQTKTRINDVYATERCSFISLGKIMLVCRIWLRLTHYWPVIISKGAIQIIVYYVGNFYEIKFCIWLIVCRFAYNPIFFMLQLMGIARKEWSYGSVLPYSAYTWKASN